MIYEKLFYNSNVVTMDAASPFAKWVAVSEGKIAAFGNELPPIHSSKQTFDLEGKTLLPGFIDSHAHGVTSGFSMNSISLRSVSTIDDILKVIEANCFEKKDDSWVFATELNIFTISEGRAPTRFELDKISGDHPVLLVFMTFHAIAANSKAMELMNIPTTMHGVEKDNSGNILGIYTSDESSFWGLSKALGYLSDATIEKYIWDCANFALSQGVTTLHSLDGKLVENDKDMFIFLNIRDKLPIHIVNYFQTTNVNLAKALGLPRIGGCLTLDGTGFERTMAISEPYIDVPTNGELYFTDAEVYQFISNAHKADLQCAMHALGDRAIEQLLTAHERVLQEQGNAKSLRHRIEHFSLPTPIQMQRAANLGLVLVMQPSFSFLWDNPDLPGGDSYRLSIGKHRASIAEPFADLLKKGCVIAGSSDSAVTPIHPLLGIHSLVNSKNPHRKLSVTDALKLFTVNGAYAANEDSIKGSISIGKNADLVVLDKNPYEDPENIINFSVEMTIVSGNPVYVKKEQL